MKYAAFMRNAVAGYFEVVSSRVKKNGMHMNNANPVISNKDSAYSILLRTAAMMSADKLAVIMPPNTVFNNLARIFCRVRFLAIFYAPIYSSFLSARMIITGCPFFLSFCFNSLSIVATM